MEKIELNKDYCVLVDDEDFEWLNQWNWFIHGSRTNWKYSSRRKRENNKTTNILMHREIWKHYNGEIPEKMHIDHINGDGLDNQKQNLRLVTPQQNMWNSNGSRNSTSKYKGVSYRKVDNKWVMDFVLVFETEKEAALMWNKLASIYYGEYAKLNKV